MLAEIIPKIAGMEQEEKAYYHRPSQAGIEKCLRALVYNAMGISPSPFPDRTMLVFNDSNWHEELTADWIRKSIYKLHSEQMGVNILELKDSPHLSERKCSVCKSIIPAGILHGHIDYMITDIDGNDYLVEHKAINHFTFDGYEQGGLIPYDYIYQTTLYTYGLSNLIGRYIPAILLIKNKNTSRYIEYKIEYDEQTDISKCILFRMDYKDNPLGTLSEVKEFFVENIIKNTIERYRNIDEYVKAKKVPNRQFHIDDWHCQYCRWGNFCWKNYQEEVDSRQEITIKDDNIIDKVNNYIKLHNQASELESKLKELKNELIVEMSQRQAKTAHAGKYVISLSQRQTSTIDKDKIPAEILAKAKKITKFEVLSIKELSNKK